MSTDLVVPALGESITEAVIARWLKKVGEATQPDEPVVDLETDKVSVQLPAPAGGVLVEQRYQEGATVKVGDVIGRIDAEGRPQASGPGPQAQEETRPVAGGKKPAASIGGTPAQRKARREGQAPPPEPEARGPRPEASSPRPVASPRPEASHEHRPDEEIVPMTQLRKTIAERLVQAQRTAAILTTFNECDMSQTMSLRARYQEEFTGKHGIKLGFMSFFVKAAVAALREFPGLNAEIRGTDIVYKNHYDIGIAVGSGKGLVVPVIRAADTLSFADLEKRIAEFGARARDGKLILEELQGGTFTITNGGIYGSMMSTPLLNFPQTGILGMHNIVKRAVVIGDEVAVRPMMYLAVSYDHRVVDGREAVQFLVGLKQRIENPERLMFSL